VISITMARDLHWLRCPEKQKVANMLRITIEDHRNAQTIKLEGKIIGAWVEELQRTWADLAPSLGSKKLQLDLRGVAFADDKGRKLLREIFQETHAGFLTNSPLTKYFADDAMQPRTQKHEGE
jgi:hypothetical protein